MELKIVQPTKFIEAIEFNFDELKEQLKQSLEKYQGLTFDAEQIKLAKVDRATLNKLKDAIETKRKEIKAKCLKPYEEFEVKIKELVKLIDEPIANIDGQIKRVEEERKIKKLDKITEIFDREAEKNNIHMLISCEKIFNPQWFNISYKIEKIEQEIETLTKQIKDNIKVIDDLKSVFRGQILDKYLQTLDLTSALAENTRLEQQQQKIEETKRRQQEEAEVKPEKNEEKKEIAKAEVVEVAAEVEEVKEEVQQIDFRVWVTKEQKQKLQKFLIDNKIKFGKVR